jgi:hypothetical protein
VELRANWDINETLRIPDKNTQILKRTTIIDSLDPEKKVPRLEAEDEKKIDLFESQ